MLLGAGASASARCDGNPPLCLAACVALMPDMEREAVRMLELLVAAGAEPSDADDDGRAAMHWAAAAGVVAAVAPLVAASEAAAQRRVKAYEADVEALKVRDVALQQGGGQRRGQYSNVKP